MKSLHTRLDPIQDEVLEYTKQQGRIKAMRKYQVGDYKCFAGWLEEATGDPQFGFESSSRALRGEDILDTLLEKFLAKVAKLEAKVKALEQENKMLQWHFDQRREIHEDHVLTVIQACEA